MMPGAVAMFSYNGTSPQTITQTVNAWQSIATHTGSRVPLLVAVDQEGGPVTRLTDGFTSLPYGAALGAMPTEDAQLVGEMAGEELSAVGITMNLAPVADVRTTPGNQLMEPRMFSSNAATVGSAVSAYIKGLRNSGVIGVLKHFPGHGAAADSHSVLPTVSYDRQHVESVELVPFRTGIENGAEVVMVGHLIYPALDPTPDLPASLSPTIIEQVLRKQLGFNGVAMTDAMDMGAIVDHFTRPVAAVMAIRAGIDLIAAGPHTPIKDQQAMKQAILDAVKNGQLSESRIEEAVRRILMLKAKHNLLAWAPLDPATASERLNLEKHSWLVNEIYMDTVSIAQDESKLLPLIPGGQKVALVYPGAFPSIKRECLSIDKSATGLAYNLNATLTDQAAAHTISLGADLVIIFTYDIEDYPTQAFLVNNVSPEKTIVVALQSPYDLETGIKPAAYVTAFNPYLPAFRAACAILYGKRPAIGKWRP